MPNDNRMNFFQGNQALPPGVLPVGGFGLQHGGGGPQHPGIQHGGMHQLGNGGLQLGGGGGLQFGGGLPHGGMMPQHGGGILQHVGGIPQHGVGIPQHGIGIPQHGSGIPQPGGNAWNWQNHPQNNQNNFPNNPNFGNEQPGWNNPNFPVTDQHHIGNQGNNNMQGNFGNDAFNRDHHRNQNQSEQFDFSNNKNQMAGESNWKNKNQDNKEQDRNNQNREDSSQDDFDNRRSRDGESHRRRSPGRDRRRSRSRRDDRDRSPSRRDDRGRSPSRREDRDRSSSREDRDKERSKERSRSPSRRDRRRDDRDSPSRRERRRRDDRDRRRDDERRDSDRRDSDRQRDWKSSMMNVKPTNTIMLKSLHPSIDERDIQAVVQQFGRPVLDVRLVRNKETGASRGFAFVEFYQVDDSNRWMEENQGHVTIAGYLAHMAYGASKEREDDWYCSQCGTQNFKRRDHCFHCSISKIESEQFSEVSAVPTRVIILNGLGPTTMEDKVCTAINYISAVNLTNVLISRDTQGNSRGYCYVELVSLEHSQHLYNTLQAMDPPFAVEEHPVSVCYGKEDYLERAQGSTSSSSQSSSAGQASETSPQQDALSPRSQRRQRRGPRKNSMSAGEKAAVALEQIQAARQLQLQQQHVSQQLVSQMQEGSGQVEKEKSSTDTRTDRKQDKASKSKQQETDAQETKTGSLEPDLSTYVYDETSGFYYDSSSGLYYDANSQYFYNATTQQYMYWDSEKQAYILVPTETSKPEEKQSEQKIPEEKEKEKDKRKTDKTAQARKIAKDMERWAKSMNNAKTAPSASKKSISFSIDNGAGAADAGFAMLQKKGNPLETKAAVAEAISKNAVQNNVLVAYGGGSDSESEEETQAPRESIDMEKLVESLTDWNKLICLLCKRQFQSKDILIKHQNISDLHKQNLEAKKNSLMTTNEREDYAQRELKYRDRAKERRDKFGSIPPPEPRRGKGAPSTSMPVPYEEPTAGGIKSDNIGNRLLQKMGWNEGTGLGKQKQGIKDPIQVSRRALGSGLGSQGSRYQRDVTGSDDYKASVHKLTRQRYQETE
ncbi:RNA-binding protein 5-like isoform X2 [Anneissia japonica]|nr:RNA-binding protein 5-like isoform X2 [Anneissia japonica]